MPAWLCRMIIEMTNPIPQSGTMPGEIRTASGIGLDDGCGTARKAPSVISDRPLSLLCGIPEPSCATSDGPVFLGYSPVFLGWSATTYAFAGAGPTLRGRGFVGCHVH